MFRRSFWVVCSHFRSRIEFLLLETVPNAMPACFEKWCQKFDDVFSRVNQREHFRTYLAGLLSESHRKNIAVIAASTVGAGYYNLHHFVHDSPWISDELNDRRLEVLWQIRQTRPSPNFKLIIDDSGHRKSGDATEGVGRQYIGQLGKVDNGMVEVTTHIFDGIRGFPVDVAMYKPAASLENGKANPDFKKKPGIALELIDKCLNRGIMPSLVLFDSGYGNNGPLLEELEKRGLKYIAALPKNRIVYVQLPGEPVRNKHKLEDVVKTLMPDKLTKVSLKLDKQRDVWVAVMPIHFPKLPGRRELAIQINAPTVGEATEIDYFITNETTDVATAAWIAESYSARNWIEVFYRETKGWLGMTEYQVRDCRSITRHWHMVFNAFTFLMYQRLVGGLTHWSSKPLATFGDAFRAFRHAVETTFLFEWLPKNLQAFTAHRATLGLKFA
jgi:hypothetical protein